MKSILTLAIAIFTANAAAQSTGAKLFELRGEQINYPQPEKIQLPWDAPQPTPIAAAPTPTPRKVPRQRPTTTVCSQQERSMCSMPIAQSRCPQRERILGLCK